MGLETQIDRPKARNCCLRNISISCLCHYLSLVIDGSAFIHYTETSWSHGQPNFHLFTEIEENPVQAQRCCFRQDACHQVDGLARSVPYT